MQDYRAPRWLPGGHLQTIWAARLARRHPGEDPPQFERERWTTPDGDFIDVDHLAPAPATGAAARRLVVFHGLEGDRSSAYMLAFAVQARRRGWACALPHFRGCSGELNRAPRAYHSGDHEEVGWILQRLRERSAAPLLAVGVSLGGNALLRWAQEAGDAAAATVGALAAVCSPIDLAAAGQAIDRGLNRRLYARMFLATMKPKALAKWQQHPGLFDKERMLRARTLYEFDDAFTAPVHGFRDTPDYWTRASARPHLARIRVPALVLNARNDPFVPAASLPAPGGAEARALGRFVTLWQPAQGGHVGFPAGAPPGHVQAMPARVADWLAQHG
ncbi:MAG: alpha/beta fold hydrolase [Rubrivivax sp.]|nr:alpha/beta fold hydrolase [Rubrivivax sp.]